MAITHNLGYPRIGAKRELKYAIEAYWQGETDRQTLQQQGRLLRTRHWQAQYKAGIDLLPVGDFAWYDQMLNHSVMIGAVPERFRHLINSNTIDLQFAMARGDHRNNSTIAACEMTKWFDTNYHYIVPELTQGMTFKFTGDDLIEQTREALELGYQIKPVIIGPLTWLWLSKIKGQSFDRLDLLDQLIPVYGDILAALARTGVEWVQVDEPILSLELPLAWQHAFEACYHQLQGHGAKIMLASYFGDLGDNLTTAINLPVEGVHLDLTQAPEQLISVIDRLPVYKVLSAGVIDGRNVWATDFNKCFDTLLPARERLGERLWLAPSCSLMHVPTDLDLETHLAADIRSWLAFAQQKVVEVAQLAQLLENLGSPGAKQLRQHSWQRKQAWSASESIHNSTVQQRLQQLTPDWFERSLPYLQRAPLQQQHLDLPLLPTTTIGSFPQTQAIRQWRRKFVKGDLSQADYEAKLQAEITRTIQIQEQLGLDLLVHGEPERNDMVEYFAQCLEGFTTTAHGWVQSYGSRCVKPPIISGDIYRAKPMTCHWISYAQSQTRQPVKGMLTGPITIYKWSFPRADISAEVCCQQLALALRDEVADLEAAGIKATQIDEPAFREAAPVKRSDWPGYWQWAVQCFRLASTGADTKTQIHTHMCYSEFNDIIAAIAALDADVITIETSRSDGELLDVFEQFKYPNGIGPGVYDIHSPNIPEIDWIEQLISQAATKIPLQRLWINPDCGLKTRHWEEVKPALHNMVTAAKQLRTRLAKKNIALSEV